MAKTPSGFTTAPVTSMKTEVWYAKQENGSDAKQIFYVQEIPALTSPKDPVTYGSLESDEEMSAKGRRKAENLTMPVLYQEEQSDELHALADSEESVWFFIKLPDETAKTSGKPRVYKFQATVDVANDTISIDNMLQETVTLYKQSKVTRLQGMPVSAPTE